MTLSEVEVSHDLKKAVNYVVQAQTRQPSREVERILKDLVTAKAMFDLKAGLPFRLSDGFINWQSRVGVHNETCNTRLEGFIAASPRYEIAAAFGIEDFDYDNPDAYYHSPWTSLPQIITAGTWYITIDDVEDLDYGRSWVSVIPHSNDEWCGVYTNTPQCEEDHPWQKVRWHYENDKIHYDFEWQPGASGPVPIRNAANPWGTPDPDPYLPHPVGEFEPSLTLKDALTGAIIPNGVTIAPGRHTYQIICLVSLRRL
jgi:hypothetical protein